MDTTRSTLILNGYLPLLNLQKAIDKYLIDPCHFESRTTLQFHTGPRTSAVFSKNPYMALLRKNHALLMGI